MCLLATALSGGHYFYSPVNNRRVVKQKLWKFTVSFCFLLHLVYNKILIDLN
jgi:hypothetical protein